MTIREAASSLERHFGRSLRMDHDDFLDALSDYVEFDDVDDKCPPEAYEMAAQDALHSCAANGGREQ